MQIIYADSRFIVINKPPGISVHGGISVSGATLVDTLLAQFPELAGVGDDPQIRPGIVHRLDKDTSGVMIVARTQESFLELKNLFQKRRIEKVYHAIACGVMREDHGIITFPIGRIKRNPLKRGITQGSNSIRGERDAVTEYRVLKQGATMALLELKPRTGRMHQLRVHCKAIGHPIACDAVYGGKNVCCPSGATRQLLHARSLSFSLGKTRFSFVADPPEDFAVAQQAIV
ncbi:MAG: RluA family pseudouridine synthase [Candidatus Sungbacteria bacterium]|nr:RluA family pseudouridine synthase [Candidatus Sungbacteria bacterium]